MGKIRIRSRYRGRIPQTIAESASGVDANTIDITGVGGQDYANEPSGFTLVARSLCDAIPTSPATKPTGWTNAWTGLSVGNLAVVTDATAPLNGPSVLRTRFPGPTIPGGADGLPPGNAPVNVATTWNSGGLPEDIGECSELFVGMKFKIVGAGTGDYEQQGVGTKWGWISGPNVTGASNDFFFLLPGPGTTGLVTQVNSTRLNQQNIVSRNLTPNVGSEPVVVGVWSTIEAHFITNTLGVSDGVFKMWVNGVQTQSYTDVLYRNASFPRKFVTYRWNPTWGGTGGANKTRDDDVYFCDIFISGKL